VGDASGIQSPISFGGFGAIIRHLGRLSNGVAEALEVDMLDRRSLALLNPYLPNLSAVWMYQRAMSVRLDIKSSPHFINTLLSVNFQCMQRLGDPVLRPFLQDVVQFGPQVQLLTTIMLTKPLFIPQILRQVRFQMLGNVGIGLCSESGFLQNPFHIFLIIFHHMQRNKWYETVKW
jgi:hypothetical protein